MNRRIFHSLQCYCLCHRKINKNPIRYKSIIHCIHVQCGKLWYNTVSHSLVLNCAWSIRLIEEFIHLWCSIFERLTSYDVKLFSALIIISFELQTFKSNLEFIRVRSFRMLNTISYSVDNKFYSGWSWSFIECFSFVQIPMYALY